jgi:hypothetical protein
MTETPPSAQASMIRARSVQAGRGPWRRVTGAYLPPPMKEPLIGSIALPAGAGVVASPQVACSHR